MSSLDTKTERVQLTLPRSLVSECRYIAEQSGLTLSKVLEHFARTGVQQGLTLTFSPSRQGASHGSSSSISAQSAPNQQHHGSKETLYQPKLGEDRQRAADEALLAEIFEPAKPLGAMTDDEPEDATNEAVPLHR